MRKDFFQGHEVQFRARNPVSRSAYKRASCGYVITGTAYPVSPRAYDLAMGAYAVSGQAYAIALAAYAIGASACAISAGRYLIALQAYLNQSSLPDELIVRADIKKVVDERCREYFPEVM